MEKKFNYFYKIENILNGKFYYGVHGTNNLEDGYMGSGLRIKNAVIKYGKENFVKENLLFFDSFDQALNYELEVVNEELLLDVSCYNLIKGGHGGHREDYISPFIRLWQIKEFRDKKIKANTDILKKVHKEGKVPYGKSFRGKSHTQETKELIGRTNSIKQTGSGNSQYGTCWITNEKENKKIHRGDLIPDGWKLGRFLKKI